MAATNKPSPSSSEKAFTVRLPKATDKKFSILKFGSNKFDFTECGQTVIARENNLKEYKQAYDIDQMPKFGAGSEFGREQKEEARRKKYGIMIKKYSVDDQPWVLRAGTGKQNKKFKGSKEGGVLENASYYIFTQCPDGAFEAHPVQEWYNFSPVINYKYLNSEEAEEEFVRRDKTMNYFSIMLKKRLKGEDDADIDGEEEGGKKKKKGKKKRDFMLTDMDEWAVLSDEDSDGDGEDEDEDKPKKPKAKQPKKKKRKEKRNSDDEALEESDSFDEGQEVDYMTDTDSEDEDMYSKEGRDKLDKYDEKGVVEEDGLRNLIDSDDEDEEEEEKKKEEEQKDDDEEKSEKSESKKKKDSDSDSSSSSESDSDLETEENFASALFMPKKSKSDKKAQAEEKASGSKSRTPTPTGDKDTHGTKRKQGSSDHSGPSKKHKSDGSGSSHSKSAGFSSSDGITEDAIRRYLQRKPMTTIDLVQKFKSKKMGLTNEQMVTTIGQILKRINPEKRTIKGKMYLSLKAE